MTDKKGLIVYFDGPDGAGKTTQLKLVSQKLIADGRDVHATRVLGGSVIGELLREAVLSDSPRPVLTDLHIAIACHYALLKDITTRRSKGEVVLIDRSPLSIIAYQVFGDDLESRVGYSAASELMELIKPDLTLVYMADAEQLSGRRHHRNHQSGYNFFENKPIEYHQRVTRGFMEAATHFETQMINAMQSVEAMQAETLRHLSAAMLTKD